MDTIQAEQDESPEILRDEYKVSDSLMSRISETAAQHGISKHQLVGYLLTWALYQVDTGKIELPSGN